MGRTGPGKPGEKARILRHGSRRVDEMGVSSDLLFIWVKRIWPGRSPMLSGWKCLEQK
jgi:hypothetical protein